MNGKKWEWVSEWVSEWDVKLKSVDPDLGIDFLAKKEVLSYDLD